MRAVAKTDLKRDARSAAPSGGVAPRSVRTAHSRTDEDDATSTRAIIASLLFLVVLAPALLVGGRAALAPLLQSAMAAREAKGLGEVLYAMPDGIYCRHVTFDNATAEAAETSIQQCPDEIIRERARNSKGFAWGR
jgi:hypothetical protein